MAVEAMHGSCTGLPPQRKFSTPVFVDELGVRVQERAIGKGGIHPAPTRLHFPDLARQHLIWPNVINNYFKGKSPEPADRSVRCRYGHILRDADGQSSSCFGV